MLMLLFGGIMVAGILAGAGFSWIPKESRFRSNTQNVLLFLLLFVLGHQLGSDGSVVSSIVQMGGLGLALAAAGMLGSFLSVLMLRLRFEKSGRESSDD